MGLLDRDVTCMLVTGKPGASKSYQAVETVVNRFLPHYPGRVLTNLPLKADAVRKYLEAKGYKDEAEAWSKRITVTDDEEASKLYDERLSVVGWFKAIEQREDEAFRAAAVEFGLDPEDPATAVALDKPRHPLEGSIVVIDEMGKLYPAGCDARKVAEFAALLAVLRHHQAKIVFLSQDMMQVDAKIRRLNEYVLYVTPFHVGRILGMGVEWGVAFEVFGWFTGYLRQGAYVQEAVQGFGDKLELQPDILPVVLSKKIFALYDTSNRPGQKAAPLLPPRFKRLRPFAFWSWVWEEAGFAVSWRLAVVVLALIVFAPGGIFWRVIPHAAEWSQTAITGLLGMGVEGASGKKPQAKAGSNGETKTGQGGAGEGGTKVDPKKVVNEFGRTVQRQNELDQVGLAKLESLLDELAENRQRIADYESLLGGEKRFVATVGDVAITADGESANVGDTIRSGVFEGKKVLVVNAGVVGLDDGAVYRVRRPSKLRTAVGAQDRSGVPNGLPSGLPSPVFSPSPGNAEAGRANSLGGVGSGVDAGKHPSGISGPTIGSGGGGGGRGGPVGNVPPR